MVSQGQGQGRPIAGRLAGCVAVVTGASGGIGEAFARQLASLGSDLILVARREDKLRALAQVLCEQYGVDVESVTLDLSEPAAAETLTKRAYAHGRDIDILVNNAGFGDYAAFADAAWTRHEQMIQVNISVPAALCHRFGQRMRDRKRPSYIVNVASVLSFMSVPYFANYSATKAYLHIFSESLASELASTAVSVTCVCPGSTATEFSKIAGQRQTQTMSAEDVAAISIRAMFKRRRVIVTGRRNWLLCLLTRLVPRHWISSVSPRLLGPPGSPKQDHLLGR